MSSSMLAAVYATDEDIFNIGNADFGVIVPATNRIARGTDGSFLIADRWTLNSTTAAFTAQGMKPGMVVRLTAPVASFNPPQYFAAQTVNANSVTLRRCGLPTGQGDPPAPASGLTGVAFECLTLWPQIENVAFDLNEKFSVDPNLSNRNPTQIYDQRIFRKLTALKVMHTQYSQLNRTKAGDFADKQTFYAAEYDNAMAAATLRWGPTGTSQPATNVFGMRLSR